MEYKIKTLPTDNTANSDLDIISISALYNLPIRSLNALCAYFFKHYKVNISSYRGYNIFEITKDRMRNIDFKEMERFNNIGKKSIQAIKDLIKTEC
jgi:hypothetical protein